MVTAVRIALHPKLNPVFSLNTHIWRIPNLCGILHQLANCLYIGNYQRHHVYSTDENYVYLTISVANTVASLFKYKLPQQKEVTSWDNKGKSCSDQRLEREYLTENFVCTGMSGGSREYIKID